ncbi:MAG: glycosyl hydrolase [Gemmatimonadetes bacterium]|nr:glycosyl hydrolase [Gemmatimonadota bacterium]
MKPRHAFWLLAAAGGLCCVMLHPATAQNMSSEVLSGLSFREIGPVNMSGRIVDLAVVESNPFTFYVASSTGGVWKTTDNGVTLRTVFSGGGTHSVGAIAVHQTDTNVVWVGTGERASRQSSSWGDGVYRSTDGGETWTHMGLRDSHHIGRIAIHPDDPNVVFVAAMGHLWGPNDERGLYRTTDGGETWTRVLEGDDDTGVVDVTYDPSDPDVMYAATYQRRRRPYGFHGGGPGSGLFKSTDGGSSWRRLTTGLPEGDVGRIGISVYRRDTRIVYVSVEQGYRYNASTAYTERRAGVYRSEDKGESWQHMSDWNPRPMYASQILVDPNDDQRIYMLNSYSFSDDGGRTFEAPRNSTHGDDRLVWVDPADSRHVMKADDGGLGISYDRGLRWLYITHLPVSQWYHVSVDMRTPYWVYGGLQDNGSWAGPSATYRAEGILIGDWFKTGGGDGFVNYIDTTDNRTLYTESQYLGLSRLDLVTRQRRWIRPGDAHGAITARRNWDAWGPGIPEPELGNAMAPANWDGPFIISPHDTRTLYAGTNILWRSRDQGDTWEALGNLTTGVNRRELSIMGQRPHDSTLSLDDGIPYYPTISAVAESPLREGLLYAGTDDGNLQISRDGGTVWANVEARLPGLPPSAWISGIEPSRHAEGTVYVAVNNYRNNDFANYLYRSDDFGRTWRAIVDGLPPGRVVRTVREDLRNANVLYLGTELGLFYSNNGGSDWTELGSNLPTLAVNDIALHPRDNDLILGTHGRGVWILDNLTALQELTPEVLASTAHLFTVQPAAMIRYTADKGHTGDMVFRGANPPAGAVIDFFLRDEQDSSAVVLTVHDASDRQVGRVRVPQPAVGINRTVWNLRYDTERLSLGGDERTQLVGPWVLPGEYTVRLAVNGAVLEQQLTVSDDPRIEIADADRDAWHEVVMTLHHVIRDQTAQLAALTDAQDGLEPSSPRATEVDELLPLVTEVRSRLNQLYGRIGGWPGRPTADQMSQMAYLQDWIAGLVPRVEAVVR